MTYRTVSTALIDRHGSDALDAAIEHARHWDAHLDVSCFAEEEVEPGIGLYGTAMLVRTAGTAQDRCDTLADAARMRLERSGVRWTCQTRPAPAGGAARDFVRQSRCADIAVLPRPLGPGARDWDSVFFDAMLFDARLPVLVAVNDAQPDYRTVLVAWDGSAVALAAARAALPVLRAADSVALAVSVKDGATRQALIEGARDAATFLSRHDVHADVRALEAGSGSVAGDILACARDIGAGLVVMGAYGHSRLRQSLLGGVTREALQRTDLNLLVAH
ncbi:universal stress protein [Roseivivax isoporae]|uniref:UspA domain-containing protein n=1 Tax=Roseivivax isoporae LMG 25204 TaxID=1449351 RepID=X7F7F0_9RHOB|nr:universal stress protein [Roseivivax isoporae]ETX28857.1 hypothetical protein RISW2_03880 [Roseivivax isoporae LMG 25204]